MSERKKASPFVVYVVYHRNFDHFCDKFPVLSPRGRRALIKKVMGKKRRKYKFS